MKLNEAIAFAQLNYTPGKRKNMFTRDLEDIQASVSSAICACRGMCGSHTGPCSMQSSKAVKGTKMCKACAMSAGGPGSGRHAVIDKYHGSFFKTVKVHDSKEEAVAHAKKLNSKLHGDDSHKFSVKKVK